MKKQFRVHLLIAFVLLGGLCFVLFHPFIKVFDQSVSGISVSLMLPFRILGENVPEFLVNALPEKHLGGVFMLLLIIESTSFAGFFILVLSGIFILNTVILAFSALTMLFRLIFNLPYWNGQRLYRLFFFLNFAFAGLCLLTAKADFAAKLMEVENFGEVLYTPEVWYYVFTGLWLALYIMTRLASKKRAIDKETQ